MSLSLTVIAHGAAEDVFWRHVPYWHKVKADYRLVIAPFDDPIKSCPWPQNKVGTSAHSGREADKRMRWLMQYLFGISADYHLVFEYDSIPLKPHFALTNGFVGNLQPNHEPTRFIAPRYANPPWMIDRGSLQHMGRIMQAYQDVYEEGFADRYLSALAFLASVPILPHSPPGYTQGTINPRNAQHMDQMRAAIKAGGVMIHGIKSEEVLDAAVQATGPDPEPLTDLYDR